MGLATVLKQIAFCPQAVQTTDIEHLEVITGGPHITNPSEVLMMPGLREFVTEVRRSYDAVIIDSPPLLAVTDPAIIGSHADGVILVVRSSSTKRHELERAAEILDAVGTPVLGIVVNSIDRKHADGFGHIRIPGYYHPLENGAAPGEHAATPDVHPGESLNGKHPTHTA